MKTRGVDSLYSWVVALSCGVVFLMAAWPARLGSLLFVEMISRYDTNRKGASLPFALATCMRSVSGPFAGFFGDKYGLQQVTILGCVFCTIGIGLCFFSEEIISIDIFFGLIYGCGMGWSSCLVPEIINQHFAKHRAKGFSVVLVFAGVLNFVTPLLMEMMLDDYGVSGTFLITAGIMLNSVPAAMLLISPSEEKSKSLEKSPGNVKILEFHPPDNSNAGFNANQQHKMFDGPESSENIYTHLSKTKTVRQLEAEVCKELAIKPKTIRNNESSREGKLDLIESPVGKLVEETNVDLTQSTLAGASLDLTESQASKPRQKPKLDSNEGRYETNLELDESKSNELRHKAKLDLNDIRYETSVVEVNLDPIEKMSTKGYDSNLGETNDSKLTKPRYKLFNILWNPKFLLITFIQSSHFYIMYVSWTVMVDLVRDKNVAHHLEVYFVMAVALLDTIGRSVLGFVTDGGHMTAGNCGAVCFGVMGFSFLLLVQVSRFTLTMTTICIFGFACGANTTVLPGIVTQFIDKEKRTIAMASRLILYAPMSFTMSPLIGFFRGGLGTYDGLLYVMTALCLSCSSALLLLPRFKAHKKVKQIHSFN